MDERAVAALESLYSGPIKAGELVRAREIFAFLRGNGQGAVLRDVPMVNGKLLDLVALLETITKRGGVRRVQDKGLWDEVTSELGLDSGQQTLFTISVHYKNFLYGFEQARHAGVGTQRYEQHGHYQRQMRQRELEQQLARALGSGSATEVCEAVNTLTLETYGTAEEELVLDHVPGLLDAIFDLMDKLNPAIAQCGYGGGRELGRRTIL
ncbi:ARID/BRIGHT DNA binding domain containing protein [Ectocarpus siliculosus]|uniref:ARID/BRIGHT DNA binding domain containing protein n=1 Tax=Ectocarpus siliculosus TaxID=2880 RepID=D8LEX2_ECTSI|nr:ARID/BRIGHT DNA binding domain containing protein [Ectocarpus siliculosus]|eukprot:CBN79792.1 ARID/BRIGHT DNA binding domain containing protein [Ectocarpus siliculosus]